MKYKVGDKVRTNKGKVGIITHDWGEIEWETTDYILDDKLGVRISDISHLIISEITDEMIDRFKKEKIAWHFKSEEDYEKTLDILYNKGLTYGAKRWKFFKECISFHDETLWRADIKFYQEEEYEIIEIMNPVYVPTPTKQEQFDENFETTDIWVETQWGKRLTKPMYKGIDCELLYQHYINIKSLGEKNIDLWNDIQRLTKENADLKIDVKLQSNNTITLMRQLAEEQSRSKKVENQRREIARLNRELISIKSKLKSC